MKLRARRALSLAQATAVRAEDLVVKHGVFRSCTTVRSGAATFAGPGGLLKGFVIGELGSKRRLRFATMLDMSFSSVVRTNDLARVYRISPAWAARTLKTVAYCLLSCLAALLRFMIAAFELYVPPTVFVSSLVFDETSEKLALPLHPKLRPEQVASSWHVLVSSSLYSFGWMDASGRPASYFMEALRPVVPLLGTSAEVIYDGLFCIPTIETYEKFEARLGELSAWDIRHFDRDGASSNEKLLARRAAALPATTLVSDFTCGNHRNSLCESAVLATHFLTLISSMWSASLLMRQGGYFMRLIDAVSSAVRSHLIISRAPPPDEATAYGKELMDLAVENYRRSISCNKKGRARDGVEAAEVHDHHRGLQEYIRAWQDLLLVLTDLLAPGLVHNCLSWDCCNGFQESVTVARVRDSITNVILRALPPIPIKAKWTKTGPCTVFFMLGMSVGKILRWVWEVGLSSLKQRLVVSGEDQCYLEDVNWHVVASSRAQKGRKLLSNPDTGTLLVIMVLLMEPSRWLTSWFMGKSSSVSRAKANALIEPPLMEFVDWLRSPITKVLQYYSSLLMGTAHRLKLLWVRAGYKSFEDWAADPANSTWLAILRQAVTVAAGSVYHRFWVLGMRWPFRLAMIADPRLPDARRREIAEVFFKTPTNILDEYFGARFRSRIHNIEDLFSPTVQTVITRWAWSVRMSVAPVEFTHGRNRRRSYRSNTWSTFVSQYVRSEFLISHAARQSERCVPLRGMKRQLALEDLSQPPRPKRTRSKTPFDLFRLDWYQQEKDLGRRVHLCNSGTWDRIASAWNALPEERRASYCEQADNATFLVVEIKMCKGTTPASIWRFGFLPGSPHRKSSWSFRRSQARAHWGPCR